MVLTNWSKGKKYSEQRYNTGIKSVFSRKLFKRICCYTQVLLTMFFFAQECHSSNNIKEAFFENLHAGRTQEASKLLEMYPQLAKARNKESETGLMFASYKGNYELCRKLVEAGADINAWTTKECHVAGLTPLHFASGSGNIIVVKYLLNNGANINAKDNNEETPFQIACAVGDVDVCKLLLERGADIDNSNKFGDTPLMTALFKYNNQSGTAVFLIKKGANILKANKHGVTPLHRAAEGGMVPVCKLLIDNNADIEARDDKMYTPLLSASEHNRGAVVKMLIEAGADINAKDKEGNTALQIAQKFDATEVIPILKSASDKK